MRDGGGGDEKQMYVRRMYVYVYVKIRRHQPAPQHIRIHAHTGPRRHARAR